MPRVRTLGQIPQLSDFERGRILEIARKICRSVGTILRCCQAVRTPEGREHRARGTGRRRMTTRESGSKKGCLPFFVTYYTYFETKHSIFFFALT
jgi:hypothetical protein